MNIQLIMFVINQQIGRKYINATLNPSSQSSSRGISEAHPASLSALSLRRIGSWNPPPPPAAEPQLASRGAAPNRFIPLAASYPDPSPGQRRKQSLASDGSPRCSRHTIHSNLFVAFHRHKFGRAVISGAGGGAAELARARRTWRAGGNLVALWRRRRRRACGGWRSKWVLNSAPRNAAAINVCRGELRAGRLAATWRPPWR